MVQSANLISIVNIISADLSTEFQIYRLISPSKESL